MKQEGLIEPPGEPPWETLKKIAEALKKNPFLKLCLGLDGTELKCEPPNTIVSKTKKGDPTTIKVISAKKIPNGQEQEVKLLTPIGTIVGFRLRSP